MLKDAKTIDEITAMAAKAGFSSKDSSKDKDAEDDSDDYDDDGS